MDHICNITNKQDMPTFIKGKCINGVKSHFFTGEGNPYLETLNVVKIAYFLFKKLEAHIERKGKKNCNCIIISKQNKKKIKKPSMIGEGILIYPNFNKEASLDIDYRGLLQVTFIRISHR